MASFRKLPVVIEAHQFAFLDADKDGKITWEGPAPEWLKQALEDRAIMMNGPNSLGVATKEGTMTASAGDWIIRGVQGELYPCKPDIFAATYEAVEQVA